ncbi:MAG TPA: hypothetical protein VH590_07130 [Ktedonobacterales bacterium]
MTCSNCGNTLAPGSTYCPVCGALTAAPELQAGEGTAAQPASAARLQARTAFYGRYGMRGNVALPQPSSLALPTTSSPPDQAKSAPSPTLTSAPAAGSVGTSAGAVPAPVISTSDPGAAITTTILPPRLRRPLAGRLIALGGVLTLLVLLVGLSALGYNAYKKDQIELRATATADTRLHATATSAAQATATASVPLFTDALASNTNGWIANGATAFFANRQYHLHNPDPAMTLNSYYQQQTFDNFRVQVTVTAFSDANPNADVPYAYGLILRADPNTPANKYVFFVSPAGTYDFARHDDGGFLNNGWTDLSETPWASSSAIHTGKGATNILTVIASDGSFTLFINGQPIETVTDSTYTSGWIGLMVEGADMEAGFSNLQVYNPGA